jgi:hypothetical protein
MSEARETLDELLDDPMIQLVMASDGVSAEDIRRLFQAGGADDPDGDDGNSEEPDLPAPYMVALACCCGRGMCA